MSRNSKRKLLKMASRTWLSLGALTVLYGMVVTSCVPHVESKAELVGIPVQAGHAPQGWNKQRLAHARALWIAESFDDGDSFSAGIAAYEMASVLHDPKWARVAIDRLKISTTQLPKFSQAYAWLGSAHALMARDYPVQGAWQVLPGPGFVRIYHVKTAQVKLNVAVELDPEDPVSRLIRASTFVSMPALFVSHETAMQDFAQLEIWARQPDINPGYQDVLRSAKWRMDFYRLYAGALQENKEIQKAKYYWALLAAEAETQELKELGNWKIASLTR